MGSDGASADTEKKALKDNRPPAVEEKKDGVGAAASAPTGSTASLGQRQLQAKSTVGGAGDEAERSADRSAEQVMRMPDPTTPEGPSPGGRSRDGPRSSAGSACGSFWGASGTPGPGPGRGAESARGLPRSSRRATARPLAQVRTRRRRPGRPRSCHRPMAAGAKPAESATPAPDPEPPAPEGQAPARETPVVTPEIQEYLDASRGKGAPLPEAARTVFEAKFQRPFDDVRIHDDAGADDTARKIDAIAFTRGNDIYFRSAAYDPTSPEGKRLLAHELTHVIQQRPGLNRKVAPGLRRCPHQAQGDQEGLREAGDEGNRDQGRCR